MAEKPSVLIIGGLGYIGRFLALHIHENKLASEVRIVDKVLPQLAWLSTEFNDACSQDKFVQADASRERTCPHASPLLPVPIRNFGSAPPVCLVSTPTNSARNYQRP
ncbi:NAD(P)-dependent oxidoreductase [Candidatus Bathyarchaeota archaeon]|nr:NAD(P)-dependent oxidoreductase [Candidatus Bathyarchaeota archaeon]